jgi:myo-inositol-1-phosphate synthase
MSKIKVAIAGIGNCACSLIQGLNITRRWVKIIRQALASCTMTSGIQTR